MKNLFFSVTLLVIGIDMITAQSNDETQYKKEFDELMKLPWKVAFNDPCTKDWQKNWHKDGNVATVENTPLGMEVRAGTHIPDPTHAVVMWIKRDFQGDLKIEYDFTSIDTIKIAGVNILYMHAQGSGTVPYEQDIFKWNDLRVEPLMPVYHRNMILYHISYAVKGSNSLHGGTEYVRARRYDPDSPWETNSTALKPDYDQVGIWEHGVKYRMTIIKRGQILYMHAKGENGKERTFFFDGRDLPPLPLEEGKIGVRQQNGRWSVYANFTVSEI